MLSKHPITKAKAKKIENMHKLRQAYLEAQKKGQIKKILAVAPLK